MILFQDQMANGLWLAPKSLCIIQILEKQIPPMQGKNWLGGSLLIF
jgi:hypothetical protein